MIMGENAPAAPALELETLRDSILRLTAQLYPLDESWEPAQYRETNERLKRLRIHITYINAGSPDPQRRGLGGGRIPPQGRIHKEAEIRETHDRRRVFPPLESANSLHSPLSFSYRAMRGEYRIYIDPSVDKAASMVCDLREKGHILFNHYERPAAHRAQFEIFFKSRLHTFLERLPLERNTRRSLGYYSTYLYNRFADVAQAMEIHSKLFRQDWRQALEFLNRRRFYRALGDPALTITEGRRFAGQLECKQQTGKEPEEFTYPRADWPLGLDWISYMSLLAADLTASLNNLVSAYSSGNGSGHSGTSGKINSTEISAYNQEREAEEGIRDAWETRKTLLESMEGDEEEGEFRFGLGRTETITGGKTYHRLSVARNLRDLVRILQERSVIPRKGGFQTDHFYHVNRNKFNTDVLIPRRYRNEIHDSGKLCILLDVSGSVPVGLVRQVVGAIAKAERAPRRDPGRLVAWSDTLCTDVSLEDLQGIHTGGGTRLAEGIRYCKRYLDESSPFFIISDFQDDLAAWLDEARDIKGRKTAVGYGKTGSPAEAWFSRVGSNGDYRKKPVELKKFIEVFDTVLIRDY